MSNTTEINNPKSVMTLQEFTARMKKDNQKNANLRKSIESMGTIRLPLNENVSALVHSYKSAMDSARMLQKRVGVDITAMRKLVEETRATTLPLQEIMENVVHPHKSLVDQLRINQETLANVGLQANKNATMHSNRAAVLDSITKVQANATSPYWLKPPRYDLTNDIDYANICNKFEVATPKPKIVDIAKKAAIEEVVSLIVKFTLRTVIILLLIALAIYFM